ncbi:endonuclease/exonuclease/phosphatase family protein [Salinimonas marina]|uniref:Endonuclease/exonuclease/phosphatase family protein n=1 Tax=Salinimonas marina TaxID=2785918 RepID=A0A7S9DZE7_9ALTE|nr:endonuclease/exonuclease/phosphatase family protein [Salinimonas marina]QPG06662.1 endonuclease/exonuclease/phosphatase family protein [Salinimonas marina]
MLLTLWLSTLFLILITLIPLSRQSHWIVRGMDFPRVQIASCLGVILVADLILLDLSSIFTWGLVLLAAICLAYQLWWILPYTPLWKSEVKSIDAEIKDEDKIRIMTSNVLTPNRKAHLLIELVEKHQPDVLVTLESDQWWEDHLKPIESSMPHTVKCPLDNLYGMHLYSRLPIKDVDLKYLVEEDVPSIHCLIQMRNGHKIRAHFVHPAPPSPTENEESSERDAELIIVGRSVANSDEPTIVTGDLNDVAWSPTTHLFRKVSKLLDPRIGRGMFNTFHATYPFLRWPLDHIFHSDHFTLSHMQRLPWIGSDHFPLLTEMAFQPVVGAPQQGVESDEDDEEQADDIVDDEDVSKEDVPNPGSK